MPSAEARGLSEKRSLRDGEKASMFIRNYRSSGYLHVELRNHGILCAQYIDDRHLGDLWGTQIKRNFSFDAANCAFFVAGTLLTQLGYFIHLANCVPIPKQQLIFLGYLY